MPRPDLDTRAGVKPDCHQFRRPGQGHLVVRQVYGQDGSRLLRCRLCGEACAERRGTALGQTTSTEAPAATMMEHRGAGGGGRATARGRQVAQDTGARLRRMAGRHAARWHEPRVRAVPPRARAWDDQGRCGQTSSSVVRQQRPRRQGPWGARRRSPRIASCACRSSSATGPTRRPGPGGMRPQSGGGRGISQRSAPRPMRAMRRPASQPGGVGMGCLPPAFQAGLGVRSAASPTAWPRGRGKNRRKGEDSSGSPCGSGLAKPACSRSCLAEAPQVCTRGPWSGSRGPGACARNARGVRRGPLPKRRGIPAGCVGAPWGSTIAVTRIGACSARTRRRSCLGARPWQPSSPTISGRRGSGGAALSWRGEIITGHYQSITCLSQPEQQPIFRRR
jgi:hypothetical protein